MKASFGVKGLNKYKSDMSVKIIKVDWIFSLIVEVYFSYRCRSSNY
jgi:hypothetical protein